MKASDILGEVLADLRRAGARPRPLLREGSDTQFSSSMGKSPSSRGMLEEMLALSDSILEKPLPVLHYSAFRRYFETGSRLEYEMEYFERRKIMLCLAAAHLATRENRYLRKLEDVLWAIADEYTWILPAHFTREGLIAGAKDERFGQIDLFSAETAFTLAEIADLLGSALDSEVSKRIRREALERVVEPFEDPNIGFGWERVENNWAAVCAGSVGSAAIYLLDDPERLSYVLQRCGRALDSYLAGFGEDGASEEGLGYWTYGFGFFAYFAELLARRTGGRTDLFAIPKVAEIAKFPQRCRMIGEGIASFSDSTPPYRVPRGLIEFLSEKIPGVEIPPPELGEKFGDDHCYRWAKLIRELAWMADSDGKSISPERTGHHFFPDAQWLIARRPRCPRPWCFAAKGGSNGESHNHNDIGAFIVYENGEEMIADLGAGEYTKGYFGPERYEYFVNSSASHSVPIVNGNLQAEGAEGRAERLRFEPSGASLKLAMDISKAYPAETGLDGLGREFLIGGGDSAEIRIRDSFAAKAGLPVAIVERFVTRAKASRESDSSIRIEGARGSILIDAATRPSRIEITEVEYKSHIGVSETARCADFVYEQRSVPLELSFTIKGFAN